jgi:hypothetical protein
MSERDYKILLATQASKGQPGSEYPFRFVLVAWFHSDGTLREYSTHMDVVDRGLSSGHYHQVWEDALQEFSERINEHNKYYKKGNVSNIPGIDYEGCQCKIYPPHKGEFIDADENRGGIQERAEQTRRKLSDKGRNKYIEGS